ncbi:AAA family ATPase [Mangrovibacterium lignilyticum]|uniref:AAA family ATPase n=1 Tax=Mangrovibacterium lignilyticum TaxID=2668052 RepID=UPI0013D7E251|nr:AAA family ATPase [Mangrovibacterium lignilyticum]
MNVRVLGQNTESPEYGKALELKEMFEAWLHGRKDKNDDVMIIPNLRLYGEEVTDLDVLIVAKFDGGLYKELPFYPKEDTEDKQESQNMIQRRVYFNSFVIALTFRKEQSAEITTINENIWLTSGNRSANISEYSKDISFSAKHFLSMFLGAESNPFVVSILNFERIPFSKYNQNEKTASFIRGKLTIDKLLHSLVLINRPIEKNTYYNVNGFFNTKTDFGKIGDAVTYFSKIRNGVGPLTKQKLNMYSKSRNDLPDYYNRVGKELLILKGGAGTGKTMKLLQLAYEVFKGGNRCLILSYNRALTQDISRLLQLSDMTGKPMEPTIEIKTIHKFIRPIIDELAEWVEEEELKKTKLILEERNTEYSKEAEAKLTRKERFSITNHLWTHFNEFYIEHLANAHKNIDKFLSDENQDFYTSIREIQESYDYVFIDEAQDWRKEERDILYAIFGSENIIIADGLEQLIRTNEPLNWAVSKGARVANHQVEFPAKSLRQKAKLCEFQKLFAEKFGTIWDVKKNENYDDGKIWVFNGELNEHMFGQLKAYTAEYSIDKYDDILFLTPGHLTEKRTEKNKLDNAGITKVVNETIKRSFSLMDEWKRMGVKIHDLTYIDRESLKQPMPGDYRLLSYDSCRGLESFAVVALEMDTFFDTKFSHYIDSEEAQKEGGMFVQSFEDKALQYASMWALIIFSRPVDLLLITIKDKESTFYKILEEINNTRPGLIQMIN